jgi:hypothetical protein
MQTSGRDRFLTTFGELELANALELRVSRREASAAQARSSWKDFEQDLRDGIFKIRPLSDQVSERARQLVRANTARLGTRTAALLHVAAALELQARSSLQLRPAAAQARSGSSPQAELIPALFMLTGIPLCAAL